MKLSPLRYCSTPKERPLHNCVILMLQAEDAYDAASLARDEWNKYDENHEEWNFDIFLDEEGICSEKWDGLSEEDQDELYDNYGVWKPYPGIWDWYIIGGRWSRVFEQDHICMMHFERHKTFMDEYNKRRLGWMKHGEDQSVRAQVINVVWKKHFDPIEVECPYLPHSTYDDDVDHNTVPLTDALPSVLGYATWEEHDVLKYFMDVTKGKDPPLPSQKIYHHPADGQLWNVETQSSEIPKDLEGWWAVMIDYHY